MEIIRDYDLQNLNTFRVPARARLFASVKTEKDLLSVFSAEEFKKSNKMFLGGGSNVLFTQDFDGIVLLNEIKGINIVGEDEDSVTIRAMGGEVWNDLVSFAVSGGYWGIENLALIYGTVAAAPMQNIGAYGAELKDVLVSVEAYDINTSEKKIFTNSECELGYRDSVFKNKLKGQYFISAITIKLSKKEKKNISYKVLQEYLEKNNIKPNSSKDISDAVSAIRESKLPNPRVIGNAGSFFKNLFVTQGKLDELLEQFGDLSYFKEGDQIKVSSAWLIEQCGWKGKRVGNVGVHDKQALVLVNHGGGTGKEIKALADEIINSVSEKFGLELVPEVNLI